MNENVKRKRIQRFKVESLFLNSIHSGFYMCNARFAVAAKAASLNASV
jgi:hypothetical protein